MLTTAVKWKSSLSVLRASQYTRRWDDFTYMTVGCVVFIIKYFYCLIFHELSTIQEGSKSYLFFSIQYHTLFFFFKQNKVPWGPLEAAWLRHSLLTRKLWLTTSSKFCWSKHVSKCLIAAVRVSIEKSLLEKLPYVLLKMLLFSLKFWMQSFLLIGEYCHVIT